MVRPAGKQGMPCEHSVEWEIETIIRLPECTRKWQEKSSIISQAKALLLSVG
jgi:hypothetical protein